MRKKQNAMPMPVEEQKISFARGALLCVADAGLAEELTQELKLCAHVASVRVATNLPDLIERMEQDSPCVILLDDAVFQDAPLSELLRQLTRTAPVILLASAERQGEILAALPFSAGSLDTLRHELLNLAASGFRLEKQALENHLVRRGMADLVARLGRGGAPGDVPSGVDDAEAQFLQAAQELREMAEIGPERQRAAARYRADGDEESWAEYRRLKGFSND